ESPALMIAFWLWRVETRGLDSTQGNTRVLSSPRVSTLLIGAGFDDRLLVVESGNPGTRQHPSVALSAQQLQQRIEVGEVRGERECASQRVAREADNRVARTDSHRSALGRERVDVEAGIGRQLPDGVS